MMLPRRRGAGRHRRRFNILLTAAVLFTVFSISAARVQADDQTPIPIAVFPFDIDVERQMGMGYGDLAGSEDERARLLKATEKLRSLLAESGRYEVLPLDALVEDITKAQPIFKCNGCEIDLAKKVNAKQSFTGTVQKASANLLNISIFIRDVESGVVVNSMAVSVRQNTDAGWLRGVRWLVRNRLLRG